MKNYFILTLFLTINVSANANVFQLDHQFGSMGSSSYYRALEKLTEQANDICAPEIAKLLSLNPRSRTNTYAGRCGPWGTPSNNCRRTEYLSISPNFTCIQPKPELPARVAQMNFDVSITIDTKDYIDAYGLSRAREHATWALKAKLNTKASYGCTDAESILREERGIDFRLSFELLDLVYEYDDKGIPEKISARCECIER